MVHIYYSGGSYDDIRPESVLAESNDGRGPCVMMSYYDILFDRAYTLRRFFRHQQRRIEEVRQAVLEGETRVIRDEATIRRELAIESDLTPLEITCPHCGLTGLWKMRTDEGEDVERNILKAHMLASLYGCPNCYQHDDGGKLQLRSY